MRRGEVEECKEGVLIPRPGALPSDSGIRDGSAGALSLILVHNLGTIMNGWS